MFNTMIILAQNYNEITGEWDPSADPPWFVPFIGFFILLAVVMCLRGALLPIGIIGWFITLGIYLFS